MQKTEASHPQGKESHRFAFLDEPPWLQAREQTEHSTGEARALTLHHDAAGTSLPERMNELETSGQLRPATSLPGARPEHGGITTKPTHPQTGRRAENSVRACVRQGGGRRASAIGHCHRAPRWLFPSPCCPVTARRGKCWLWGLKTVDSAEGWTTVAAIRLCGSHGHRALASSEYVTYETRLEGREKRTPFHADNFPGQTALRVEMPASDTPSPQSERKLQGEVSVKEAPADSSGAKVPRTRYSKTLLSSSSPKYSSPPRLLAPTERAVWVSPSLASLGRCEL